MSEKDLRAAAIRVASTLSLRDRAPILAAIAESDAELAAARDDKPPPGALIAGDKEGEKKYFNIVKDELAKENFTFSMFSGTMDKGDWEEDLERLAKDEYKRDWVTEAEARKNIAEIIQAALPDYDGDDEDEDDEDD